MAALGSHQHPGGLGIVGVASVAGPPREKPVLSGGPPFGQPGLDGGTDEAS